MEEFMNLFSLKGKKAIVTGGSRGLGYGMAEGLCMAGADVVIVATSEAVYESAAKLQMEAPGRVLGIIGNLEQEEKVPQIYRNAVEALGGQADILVNCAGIQHRCKAEDFTMEDWNRIIRINLSAVFQMSQLAARDMMSRGYGRIINVASMTSFFGSVMIPAYTASKGGVAQLTKALSNEWASRGVTVNAVAPGYMETKLTSDMKTKNPGQYEEVTSRIPMNRWGTAEDLRGITVFLASDAAAYITGTVIPVDGGYLAK
jgi:2-deoxy-D-gluconate 3-dehydrogenase